MGDGETRVRVLGRLRRLEGQVQGLQRMIAGQAAGADVLLQVAAAQGALAQVQKLLMGVHLEACVSEALRAGTRQDRQRKIDELLEVVTRFGGRK